MSARTNTSTPLDNESIGPLPLRTEADATALAQRLANDVLAALSAAVAERGTATLVVSGGSTPEPLFERLAADTTLDWSAVTITLADERAVPADHEASNEGFVARTLMKGSPSRAAFVSLYAHGLAAGEAAALRQVSDRIAAMVAPFDVLLLGMGGDGHTASLFPDAPELETAMSAEASSPVSLQRPVSQPLVRLTLNAARLWRSKHIWLHIVGDDKRAVLERALADGDLPIARVMNASAAQAAACAVYWSA